VLVAVVLAAAIISAAPRPASAALFPATVLDGPSSAILDVDGTAMAPDGTGGIAYRKLVGGLAHVFVVPFRNGTWQPPVQVDTGQPFAGSEPAIAAGDGGRLLVVWVEPYATVGGVTHFELLSSELAPGANAFGQAIDVDPKDVGDGTAAFPSLSMAPNGAAYVVYRVVTDPLSPGEVSAIRPFQTGDELMDVRVARYNRLTWSGLGAINRAPMLPMRQPTAANAPAISINSVGTEAVVTWQEPSVDGVSRIWARRVFGATLGNVLEVSPETWQGRPVSAEADAPAIGVSTYNEAWVSYRLAPGTGSPYPTTSLWLNDLPSSVGQNAKAFVGANPISSAPGVGQPSVSTDQNGDFRLAYTASGAVDVLSGGDRGVGKPAALEAASGDTSLETIDPAGGGVTAWQTTSDGQPVVHVREDLAGGAMQEAQLAAPIGGSVSDLSLGGSSLGDALVGFIQGPASAEQVIGAVAQAPPAPFLISTPAGWVNGTAAQVTWDPAPEAIGSPTYSVVVDGQTRVRGIRGLQVTLNPRGLGDGVHAVQVMAVDSNGQEALSHDANLMVDASPPFATLRALPGRAVQVTVKDAGSGAVASATTVSFGDGGRTRGRLRVRHTYDRPGAYVITVTSADQVGNRGAIHLRVRVR
jgi:hypothetical protein